MTLIKKELKHAPITSIKIPLRIPEAVYNQIKYLCREISTVEWSGILFYKESGSIKNLETFSLEAVDIYLMDKGSAAYTSYDLDETIIAHMEEYPHLQDCRIGHIHSHNNMGVFFSGTDTSELEDNAPNHNFYLSLIVNNRMDFVAKVCFISKATVNTDIIFKARDEEGNFYNLETEAVDKELQRLHIIDCEIFKPIVADGVDENFKARVKEINVEKKLNTCTTKSTNKQNYPLDMWPGEYVDSYDSYTPTVGTTIIKNIFQDEYFVSDFLVDWINVFRGGYQPTTIEGAIMKHVTKTDNEFITTVLSTFHNVYNNYVNTMQFEACMYKDIPAFIKTMREIQIEASGVRIKHLCGVVIQFLESLNDKIKVQ